MIQSNYCHNEKKKSICSMLRNICTETAFAGISVTRELTHQTHRWQMIHTLDSYQVQWVIEKLKKHHEQKIYALKSFLCTDIACSRDQSTKYKCTFQKSNDYNVATISHIYCQRLHYRYNITNSTKYRS